MVPAYPPFGAFGFTTLRHTFATMQLSAGVHFTQVSKWFGHSTYTLTLDVYGDWILRSTRYLNQSLRRNVWRRATAS